MAGKKDHDDDESPELEAAEEPIAKVKAAGFARDQKEAPHNPLKHLSRIDPVLVERLEREGPSEYSPAPSMRTVKESVPNLRAREKSGGGSFPWKSLIVLAVIGAAVYGYYVIFLSVDEAPVSTTANTVAAAGMGKVFIDTDLLGIQVFANKEPVQVFNNVFETPAGRALELEIRRAGFESYRTNVMPVADQVVKVKPVFAQELPTGSLVYDTVPSSKLTLYSGDKVAYELTTPVNQKIAVGKYRAVLENPLIGFRSEEELVIEEWKTTSKRRELPQTPAK